MGAKNFLIDGPSGAGKTTLAGELERRGFHCVHGDRVLAYRGDPESGRPLSSAEVSAGGADPAFIHRHHLWDIDKFGQLVGDHRQPMTFFCGGARNRDQFIETFDAVFWLDIDRETLVARLAARPEDEFGGQAAELAFILQLHERQTDRPAAAIPIDARAPLEAVADEILRHCRARL